MRVIGCFLIKMGEGRPRALREFGGYFRKRACKWSSE